MAVNRRGRSRTPAEHGTRRSLAPGVLRDTALVLCAITLVAVQTPVVMVTSSGPLVIVLLLSVGQAAAIVLAPRLPFVALVLSLLTARGLMQIGHAAEAWPWQIVPLITQLVIVIALGLWARWYWALLAAGGGLLIGVIDALVEQRHDRADAIVVNLVIYASMAGGLAVLALVIQYRQTVREQVLVERRLSAQARAERELVEEKTRIARELHDVIAHSMSLITVQASTAPYRHPGTPEPLVAEFTEIAAAARQALAEMRGVLGVLRSETDAGERAPQPGLDDIPALIDQGRAAGGQISVALERHPGAPTAESTALVAYRIVQEALSNALRHAPGATIDVELVVDARGVRVRVESGAAEDRSLPAAPGAGHGLRGMTERAVSVGGNVDYGVTESGGFLVRASLPPGPGGPSPRTVSL